MNDPSPQANHLGPRSLKRNLVWVVLANLSVGIYQWSLVVILAKMGGPGEVGLYSLGLAAVTPVQMFLSLQVRSIQASDTVQEYHFRDYVGLRLATTLVGLSLLAAYVVGFPMSKMTSVILAIAAVKFIESYSEVLFGEAQRYERMEIPSISRLFISGLSFTTFLVAYNVTSSLAHALAWIAIVQLLVIVLYTIPSLARLLAAETGEFFFKDLRGSFAHTRQLAVIALPLGFVMGIISINDALPRWFLGHHFDEFEVGIYAGFAQMISVGFIVTSAIGQVLTPRFSRLYGNNKRDAFFRLQNGLTLAAILVGVSAALFALLVGDYVLQLLYTSEYSGFSRELAVMALAAGCMYGISLQGFAMTAARMIHQQVYVIAPSMLLLAGLLWWLVPWAGLLGAAISVLICNLAQLAGLRVAMQMRWTVQQ